MSPLVIHLEREGFESAYQALTFALTARAMGQDVAIVLAFGALRALAEDRLGEPLPGPDRWTATRAGQIGTASLASMLADARALDVKLWACETVARMAGVDPEQLAGKAELVGLPQIIKHQQNAQVLYL